MHLFFLSIFFSYPSIFFYFYFLLKLVQPGNIMSVPRVIFQNRPKNHAILKYHQLLLLPNTTCSSCFILFYFFIIKAKKFLAKHGRSLFCSGSRNKQGRLQYVTSFCFKTQMIDSLLKRANVTEKFKSFSNTFGILAVQSNHFV